MDTNKQMIGIMDNHFGAYQVIGAGNSAFGAGLRLISGEAPAPMTSATANFV
jgi:hypothetical protein